MDWRVINGRWCWCCAVATYNFTNGWTRRTDTWWNGGRQQHVGGRSGRTKNREMLSTEKTSLVYFWRVWCLFAVSASGSCHRSSATEGALRAATSKTFWDRAPRCPRKSCGLDSESSLINWNWPSVSEALQFYLCHSRLKWILSRENGLFLKLAAMWRAVHLPGQ